jgi:hypothetical protein
MENCTYDQSHHCDGSHSHNGG